MDRPTVQSIHGATSAIPNRPPDRVTKLLFRSNDELLAIAGRGPLGAAPERFAGVPVALDSDVPEGVCRQVYADGRTADVPL